MRLSVLLLLCLACAPAADDPPVVVGPSEPAGHLVLVEGYAPATEQDLRGRGWRTDFARGAPPLGRIHGAGLPRGIFEPIRAPRSAQARALDLAGGEPVLVLRGQSQVHAWPLVHLLRRELALEEVEGTPLAVTYCSLCDSARLFDRRLDGEVLELGVSGLLLDGNALLFDARTHSLWSQRDGLCIAGAHAGKRLDILPAFVVSFAALREAHPAAAVRLAAQDGAPDPPLLLLGAEDIARGTPPDWLRTSCADPLARVLSLAGHVHELDARAALHVADAVLLGDARTASAHRTAEGTCGPAIGSAAAFRAQLDGRALHFELDAQGIRDRETGSRWNALGEATAGPLAGRYLAPVPHLASLRLAAPGGGSAPAPLGPGY